MHIALPLPLVSLDFTVFALVASPLKRLVSVKHIVNLHHKLETILNDDQRSNPLQEACDHARTYAASVMLELFHWQAPRCHTTLWQGSIRPGTTEPGEGRQLALAYWPGYGQFANRSARTGTSTPATAIVTVAPDPLSGLTGLALRHMPVLRHPTEGRPVTLEIDVRGEAIR